MNESNSGPLGATQNVCWAEFKKRFKTVWIWIIAQCWSSLRAIFLHFHCEYWWFWCWGIAGVHFCSKSIRRKAKCEGAYVGAPKSSHFLYVFEPEFRKCWKNIRRGAKRKGAHVGAPKSIHFRCVFEPEFRKCWKSIRRRAKREGAPMNTNLGSKSASRCNFLKKPTRTLSSFLTVREKGSSNRCRLAGES